MRKYARCLTVAAVLLAPGVFFLTAAHGRDDELQTKIKKTKAAKEAVLKLAADMNGKESDVKKEATAVAAQYEMEFVMNQFLPRTTSPDKISGLGVGPKPGVFQQDSIELELIDLSDLKTLLSKADLASQQADLQRMAEATLAVAELMPYYAPQKDEEGKPIKDWLKLSADMRTQSKELIAAVKSGEPKTVQTAALSLSSDCDACHTKFRDQ